MKGFPHTVRCIFLFLNLCLLVACTSSPKTPLPEEGGVRVLFIGNSFTYWNDLPRTIADLAKSLDETPMVYQEVAKPDYSLEDHWFKKVGEVTNQGGWNLVVMQQGPSSHPKSRKNLRYWTARYDVLIKAAGARSALYQVWSPYRHRKGFTAARESYRQLRTPATTVAMLQAAAHATVKTWGIP